MTNTVVNMADEIFRELGQPSDISIASICFWIRSNVGKLNNALETDYDVDDQTSEYDPLPEDEEKDVLKLLYCVYYYKKQLTANLGAAANESVVEVTSDGATVRTTNKTNLSQVYRGALKDLAVELDLKIKTYKARLYSPAQVAGDDTVIGEPYPFHTVPRS